MTKTLEKAFAEASRLAPKDQNVFAKWMLAELESEARWQRAFKKTPSRLAELADEALSDHHAGRTRRLEPKSL